MKVDVEALRAAAADRFGDVLQAVGVELARWSRPDRGRARCPMGCTQGFPASYRDGRIRCHYEAKSWDAIALLEELDGLDFLAAAEKLASILGGDFREVPRRRPQPEPVRKLRSALEVTTLWNALPASDATGEAYLRGRGLWEGPLPDVVRFNPPGVSSDEDLERRARQGYRVAFAARRPDGTVGNISLRFTGPGAPPNETKTVTLRGASTKLVAIARPAVAELVNDFPGDAVLFCEGGPDWLAWTRALDRAALEGAEPSTWALGIVGAGVAESVVRAFAPLLRGRWIRLALDADRAGEDGAARAAEEAWKAGAERVTRITLEGAKDAAEAAEQEAHRA